MKKMMIALAGIVSVMMLASCQREVEIDDAVEIKTVENDYNYRLKAKGTVKLTSSGTAESHDITEGRIEWKTADHTNERSYELSFRTVSDTDTYSKNVSIVKYDGKFYWNSVNDKNSVTVTDPESSTFTVTGFEIIGNKTVTYNLTFTR